MVQFLSIIFFLGFLQFSLGFSKVPVLLCHSVLLENLSRLVTRLWPERSGVRFLTKARDVSLHQNVQIRGPPGPLFSVGTDGVFPREKIDRGVKLVLILRLSGTRPPFHL